MTRLQQVLLSALMDDLSAALDRFDIATSDAMKQEIERLLDGTPATAASR